MLSLNDMAGDEISEGTFARAISERDTSRIGGNVDGLTCR
jgi:hypothetical protein